MKPRRQSKQKRLPKPKPCFFCTNRMIPSLLDLDTLRKCITERGKIVSRLRSGICNKHQKEVTREVKRARFVALLPYIVQPL